MWIILHVHKPRGSLRGYCRRYMLEPSPNLFVGKATKTLKEDIERRIEESGSDGFLIRECRESDLGLSIRIFGNPEREIVDLNGFQVVKKK